MKDEKEKNLKIELMKTNQQALKYRSEYAQQLRDHLKAGLSFDCFNVTPRVSKTTLKQWVHDHEEFRLAKEEGEDSFQNLLERLAYNKTLGTDKELLEKIGKQIGANPKKIDTEMLRFLLTKRFRKTYSERIENVVQNPDGSKIEQRSSIDLDKLSAKELKAMLDIMKKAKKDV